MRPVIAVLACALIASGCLVGDPSQADLLKPSMVPAGPPAMTLRYGPDPVGHLADLYTPAGWARGDSRPVMLYVHGGAWAGGDRSVVMDLVKAQLRRGWVVISVDYRLMARVQGTDGIWRSVNRHPAQVIDIDRAVRWVRWNHVALGVNPNKLVTAGHSAGAHLVLLQGLTAGRWVDPTLSLSMRNLSARPQGIVALSPPTDLAQFRFTVYGISSDHLLNTMLGCPMTGLGYTAPLTCTAQQLASASPITYASADDPPVYIGVGDSDSVLYPRDAWKSRTWMADVLHAALRRAGQGEATYVDVADRVWRGGSLGWLPEEVRGHLPNFGLSVPMFEFFLDQVVSGRLR